MQRQLLSLFSAELAIVIAAAVLKPLPIKILSACIITMQVNILFIFHDHHIPNHINLTEC